nr:MAG TPA: PlyB like endolysin [Caudoviricetes sp.]
MTISGRAIYIYNKCRSAGMTHNGAIGLLGNLQGETSDFDPMSCETMYLNRYGLTDAEYTRRADDGEKIHGDYYFTHDSAGYGIVQWTWWARKKGLLDYAKSKSKSVGDLDIQIEYMIKELTESYTSVWKVLTTTDSYYEAVKHCVITYEKPANQADAIAKRTNYAKAWLSIIDDESITPDEPKEDNEPVGDSYDRRKVIALAMAEVGYLEKKSNDQLDDKTANAGSANFTKYARDLDAIGDFYNGKKNGYAWCDVFVDWLMVKCFGVESALKLLCADRKSSGAGCTYSLNYYKAKGQFYTRATKPQVGDQIFFGSVGNSSHTGIVYKVDDTTVYTIEGNTSGEAGVIPNGGGVFKKAYPGNYTSIAGYGRPAYNDGFTGDSIEDDTIAPDEPKQDDKTEVTMPTLKKGDRGGDVKKAQQLLIAKGYSCGSYGADGDFGSGTLVAVNKLRKDNSLTETGIIDNDVWVILLDLKKDEEPKQDEPKEVEVTFNPPTLKKGDKGIAVKKLQHLLADSGISVGSSGADADFGNGTYNAVKIAQAKAKLPVTGIVDKAIWAWLINN